MTLFSVRLGQYRLTREREMMEEEPRAQIISWWRMFISIGWQFALKDFLISLFRCWSIRTFQSLNQNADGHRIPDELTSISMDTESLGWVKRCTHPTPHPTSPPHKRISRHTNSRPLKIDEGKSAAAREHSQIGAPRNTEHSRGKPDRKAMSGGQSRYREKHSSINEDNK